jgi:hypothetical protein
MPDLSELVETAAAKPASATVDGQSMSAVSIPDLIEAAHFQAGQAAVVGTNDNGGPKSGWRMTRPARVVPPGAS